MLPLYSLDTKCLFSIQTISLFGLLWSGGTILATPSTKATRTFGALEYNSGAEISVEPRFDTEGRLYVDLLPIVKRDYKFDTYTLKNVSNHFLGETKDTFGTVEIPTEL